MGHSTRRWRALAAVVVTGVSVVAFNSSVSPVAGEGPVQTSRTSACCAFTCRVRRSTVTFTPSGASQDQPTVTQPISVTSKCGASTSGPLVTITMSAAARGSGSSATDSESVRRTRAFGRRSRLGQREGDASLSARGSTSDVVVADAELDVEGKFDASLDVLLDSPLTVNSDIAECVRQRT